MTEGRTGGRLQYPHRFFLKKKRGDNKGHDKIVQLVLNFKRVLNI